MYYTGRKASQIIEQTQQEKRGSVMTLYEADTVRYTFNYAEQELRSE